MERESRGAAHRRTDVARSVRLADERRAVRQDKVGCIAKLEPHVDVLEPRARRNLSGASESGPEVRGNPAVGRESGIRAPTASPKKRRV